MLTLPSSLEISRSPSGEKRLLQVSREWLEKEERDPRTHVSDLLDPLYGYWQRRNPQPISDRLVTIFLVGKLLHAFVLSAVDGVDGVDWKSDEGQVYDKKLDLVWSADKVIKNIPRELKTSRSFYEPKTVKDLAIYCEQLLCYMAVKNVCSGQLWVLFLNAKNSAGKTEPAYRCYTVHVSQADLDEFRANMVKTNTALKLAIKTANPSKLPLCRTFKCGERNCVHWKLCRPPGRFGLDKTKEWTA